MCTARGFAASAKGYGRLQKLHLAIWAFFLLITVGMLKWSRVNADKDK